MYNKLSLYTLKQMDITPWVIRRDSLLDQFRKPKLYVFFDAQSSAKERQLLDNILDTLKNLPLCLEINANLELVTGSGAALDFGSEKILLPDALTSLPCPDLKTLLNSATAKKSLYQILVQLF